jgi:hypothetical protein
MLTASSTAWQVGLVLGIVVIAVAAAIVIAIVLLARRIAAQAKTAVQGDRVRSGSSSCGSRITLRQRIHAARALRKTAVGK